MVTLVWMAHLDWHSFSFDSHSLSPRFDSLLIPNRFSYPIRCSSRFDAPLYCTSIPFQSMCNWFLYMLSLSAADLVYLFSGSDSLSRFHFFIRHGFNSWAYSFLSVNLYYHQVLLSFSIQMFFDLNWFGCMWNDAFSIFNHFSMRGSRLEWRPGKKFRLSSKLESALTPSVWEFQFLLEFKFPSLFPKRNS